MMGRAALLLALAAASTAMAQVRVLDDFESVDAWTAVPADGVRLDLSRGDGPNGGHALRMDFDFQGHGGYAIARRPVRLVLGENYRLRFSLLAENADGSGRPPVNDLEFKLVSPDGDNVWWHNRRRFQYPVAWAMLTSRPRHVSFAWGPRGESRPDSVGFLEIVVTAAEGGAGTVWIDDLTVEHLPPERPYAGTPTATAASGDPAPVLDGDASTVWRGAGGDALTVDFGEEREFGGLWLDWQPNGSFGYTVETSTDGDDWHVGWLAQGARGGRLLVPLPEASARYVKITTAAPGDLAEVEVLPLEATETRTAIVETLAADAPRGLHPEALLGRQTYWTVTGVDGDEAEALVGEHGDVEVRKGAFSVEPFLWADGLLLSWVNADTTTQALDEGYRPIPSVTRRHGDLALTVTAIPVGTHGDATLVLRYRIENLGATERPVRLLLAVRPLQVNPPSQWLNTPGGAGHIGRLAVADGGLDVDDWSVSALQTPGAMGVTTFDAGDVSAWLAVGTVPPGIVADDPLGFASGTLRFDRTLAPGEAREVGLTVPLAPSEAVSRPMPEFAMHGAQVESWQQWHALENVEFVGPEEVQVLGRTLKSQLAYILVNRDGPRLQPGSRSYERSWIRDGALTSSALLRMGVEQPAVDFARWFAPFQYPSGKVPCCVDARGADPTPENDSHGQLILLVAEIHRFTRDDAFLREMWPHVRAAALYMDSLRHDRMTPAYRSDTLRAYYGLLPESISHEGYSARPMHSYWDQLFALRGFTDAVYVAMLLGETADATRIAAMRDAFASDLAASYRLAMEKEGIDYLPGSVELGDFDPTSVSIAMDPVHAGSVLPDGALERTYERYWTFFGARRDGAAWNDYTPYEWRNVSALVRLGHRDRALEAMRWFLADVRPAGWNAFAEVVGRAARRPRFVGDIPHTWVGSDFVRAALDLFAYDTETPAGETQIVVGAGLDPVWLDGPEGVGVDGLRTTRGPLSFVARRESALAGRGAVAVDFTTLPDVPPGGIVVHSPLAAPVRATIDGRYVPLEGGAVVLRAPAARVVFSY